MLPMKALRIALGNLLAADATTLAPAVNENKIALIALNFALTEDLVAAGLTYATFTGSTPLDGVAGAQQVGINPLTGEQVITILAPVGGWRWECTVAPGAPETIFGYALLNAALDTLLGAALLDTPITITAATQFVDLGQVPIRFVLQPMS